jgi:two-component system, chemotaxis family, response regulator Rcp1
MAFLRQEGAHLDAPRPHIVLLDLKLPKMGGLEVLAQIKNDKHLKAIPTIILSTSDLESDIRSAYENYANCYFIKPAEWDAFGIIVKHVNDIWLGLARLPDMEGAL